MGAATMRADTMTPLRIHDSVRLRFQTNDRAVQISDDGSLGTGSEREFTRPVFLPGSDSNPARLFFGKQETLEAGKGEAGAMAITLRSMTMRRRIPLAASGGADRYL
jgi:hypothetical protein